jgi:hypothetical protein
MHKLLHHKMTAFLDILQKFLSRKKQMRHLLFLISNMSAADFQLAYKPYITCLCCLSFPWLIDFVSVLWIIFFQR